MSFALWRAKRLTKTIWKREAQRKRIMTAIKTLDRWIKQDKQKLNALLKTFDKKDTAQYGFDLKYIDKFEYQELMEEKEDARK